MKSIAISPTNGMWSVKKNPFLDDSAPAGTTGPSVTVSAEAVGSANTAGVPGGTAVELSFRNSDLSSANFTGVASTSRRSGTLSVVEAADTVSLSLQSRAAVSRGSEYIAPAMTAVPMSAAAAIQVEVPEEIQYTVAAASSPVLLPYEMPRAEYMYGCTATVVAMIFAYYDRNGYTVNGQTYSTVNLIKGGEAELNSRGLDGDSGNMNSFNTLVGKATASERHVAEFFNQTPETELKNTFVGDTNEIDQSRWDCLADYMGTNQMWRDNDDYSSLVFLNVTLGEIRQWTETATFTYGDIVRVIPVKMMDYSYGLSLYVADMGNYRLHDTLTATYDTDNNGGIFTFEMYKAEIDAGRAVHIGIEEHSMVGYGYDAATKEIIFDDTYESGKRMKWGGSYYYAGASRKLQSISTIAFDTSYLYALPTVTGSLEYQMTRRSASSKLENLTASAQKTATTQILYTVSGVTGGSLYLDVNNNNILDDNEKTFSVGSFAQSDIDSGKVKFLFADGSKAGTVTFKVANGLDSDNGQYLWSSAFQYQILGKKNPDPVTIHAPTIDGNNVTLTWDIAEAGLKYEVQYSLTADFALFTQTTLTVGEWNLNRMADNLYYWRVRAVDSDKDASEWEGSSFRVDTIAPGIPTIKAPQVTNGNVLFQWNAVDDASSVSYEIEYSLNADFSGAKKQVVTATQWLLTGLADEIYHWRMRAFDAAGNVGEWTSKSSFRVDTTAPDQVAAETPKLYGTRVEFRWSEVSDVSGVVYELEYADNPDFTDAVRTVVNGKTKFAVNDMPEGQYYWRIRAVDGAANAAPWTPGAAFLVDTIPPAIEDVFVPAYSEDEIVWHWSDAVEAGGLAYYELEYAATSSFTDSVTLRLTDTSYTLTQPPSQRYFWRIRAVDTAGNASRWQMGTPFQVIAETGSDFETAREITFNRAHEERLGGEDLADMFKVTLTAGKYALTANGVDTPLRADIKMYDADGKKILLKGSTKKTGSLVTKSIVLEAGTYYILVASADKGKSEGLYSLKVTGETFDKANQANDDEMTTSPLVSVPGTQSRLEPVALMADEWVGLGDASDFRRVDITTAGKYDFTLTNLRDTAKLTVFGTNGKKLKSITVKAGSAKNAITGLLLNSGLYYVQVEAPGAKKAQNTPYSLTLTGETFIDANQANDDERSTSPLISVPGTQSILEPVALMADEWVGTGDASDFRRVDIAAAGKYDFTLTNLSNTAKLTVFSANGKKIKSLSVKAGSAKNAIADLLLQSGLYFVQVEAPGAKKAQNTPYDLTLTGEVFNRGNTADNTAATATQLDLSAGVRDEWVGYGDEIDYYRFSVSAETAGSYSFQLTGEAKMANLTIYLDRPDKTPKQLKRATIGKDGTAVIGGLELEAGNYLVAVASADKGKGKKNTAYDLAIELPSPTVPLVPESASMQLASLPDLSGDGLNSGWGLDAALAPELSCASNLLDANDEERKRSGLLASA